MSNIISMPARTFVAGQNRVASRGEEGQATSEYGVVILVAIALGLAVLALFTSGKMDDVLEALLKTVLDRAKGMV